MDTTAIRDLMKRAQAGDEEAREKLRAHLEEVRAAFAWIDSLPLEQRVALGKRATKGTKK